MIDAIFKGKTVAIVGGGASLTGFDFRRLRGYSVIALTKSFQSLPDATLLWWSGSDFWRGFKDGIIAHRAPFKATGDVDYQFDELPPEITQYHFTGTSGVDPDPNNLRTGNCSVYAAMQLAPKLGAAKLVLFGVDMKFGPNGEQNYHDGYGIYQDQRIFETMMLPHFADLVQPFADGKVEVINASHDSALTLWPRVSVDDGVTAMGAASIVSQGDPPVTEESMEKPAEPLVKPEENPL